MRPADIERNKQPDYGKHLTKLFHVLPNWLAMEQFVERIGAFVKRVERGAVDLDLPCSWTI
jgi:hypothetical protein